MTLRKKISRRFTKQPPPRVDIDVPALPRSNPTTPTLALPTLRPGSPLLSSPLLVSQPQSRSERRQHHRRSRSFSAIDSTPPIRPFADETNTLPRESAYSSRSLSTRSDTDHPSQPWRDRETWKALHTPPPETSDWNSLENHPGLFPEGSGGWRRRKSDAVLGLGSATRSASSSALNDQAFLSSPLSPKPRQRKKTTETNDEAREGMSREAQEAWNALASPRPKLEPLGVPITPSPLRLGADSPEPRSTTQARLRRPSLLRSPLSIQTPSSRSPTEYTSRFQYDGKGERGRAFRDYSPSSPTFGTPLLPPKSALRTPSTSRPRTPLNFSSLNISSPPLADDDELMPPLLPSALSRTAHRATSFTSLRSNPSSVSSDYPAAPPIPWGVRDGSDRGRASTSPTPWVSETTTPPISPSKLSPRSSYSTNTSIQVDLSPSRNASDRQSFPAYEEEDGARQRPYPALMYPLHIGPGVMMKDDEISSPIGERVTTPETPHHYTPTSRRGVDRSSLDAVGQAQEESMAEGAEPWVVPKDNTRKASWASAISAGDASRARRGGLI